MKSRILKSLDLVLRCMRVSVLTGPRSQTCRPPCWRLSQNSFGAARLPKDFKPVQRRAGRHTLCWEAEEAWCLFDFLFFFLNYFSPSGICRSKWEGNANLLTFAHMAQRSGTARRPAGRGGADGSSHLPPAAHMPNTHAKQ